MVDKEKANLLSEQLKAFRPEEFSFLGGGSSDNISQYAQISDDFGITEITSWILDPDRNKSNIVNASRYFYISKAYIYQLINYYANILKLDYAIVPEFKTMDMPDAETLFDEVNDVRNYLEYVLSKPTIRTILKTVLKEGVYYGYERNEGDVYDIQHLPSEYCRPGSVINGLTNIDFDFSLFGDNEELLEKYPPEFKSLYTNSLRDGETSWQELDNTKSVAILLEENDFSFPLITGMFIDLLTQEEFYDYMKKGIQRDISRILIQKGELDPDTGEPLTNPDVLQFFHQAIESALRDAGQETTVVSTLFDVDSIDFTKSKSSDAGYTSVDSMDNKVSKSAGVPDELFGGGKNSATSLKLNHDKNKAFTMSILEKIEKWINIRLKERSGKDVYFKVKYLPTTYNDSNTPFKSLLDIGGSLLVAISEAGMNPYDYMNMVKFENIMKFKDDLTLPQNINTASTNKEDAGRPKKDDGDLSDGGEQTRDSDGNDR